MRRIITAIIAFLLWLLAIGTGLMIMDINICFGLSIMLALTSVILICYALVDNIMADLDREGRERKYRKELAKIRASQNTVLGKVMGAQPINPAEPRIKKEKKIFLGKLLKFKKKIADFEILATQSREYRGRNINKQSLD